MTEEEKQVYMQENDEKIRKYVAWLDYETGFSGRGTTLLDKQPDCEKPSDIPEEIKSDLELARKEWAMHKQQCFKDAMLEVLGCEDDLGDW